MAKKLTIAGVLVASVLVIGAVGLRMYRGPVGDEVSTALVPEFPSLDPSQWKNGEPMSLAASRGEVVFLEGWSPT